MTTGGDIGTGSGNISTVDGHLITNSGNIYTFDGNIGSYDGGFFADGYSGITDTWTIKDGNGNYHSLRIRGGIITGIS